MVTAFIVGSLFLGQANTQIGQIKRPTDKFRIAPVEPSLMVLDEYVFSDGSASRSYSLHTFSSFSDPQSMREATYGLQALAADRKGNVYGVNWVGDSRDPYLYVPSFHAVEDGQKWTGPLKRPMGVACDRSGKIYIIDATLSQVIRVNDHLGNGMVRFGSPGTGIGQFKNPSGIAVGPTGQIYIADTGNQRIVRIDDFEGNGWNMAWFGGPASGGGRISLNPTGISIDSYDQIFVSDQGIQQIVRIDDFDKKKYRYLHPTDKRQFRPSRLAAFVPAKSKLIR